ncbi:Na+/H+ antiporter [Chryseobacterium vrystaatense]|uniref:Monovalent cation:H+ antiporter, CPA1 family n=1 Tax=Chryseobacterium vrystaatense TaxID=307480 RepID=A0A1M5EAW6_9FLAO|nr:Na+/H+ antiporter [Chryseobacterium vrystaatense]KFF25784.1 sodium:proton exchanger [Chryseobacterium vrystaatense]SHF76403.1 monovalent cation:H+ antiporter, CPA1 family [Chryseobacterium vrystaatense]
MENYAVILVIMALMIGISGLAGKIKIPVPMLLLIAGIMIGFVPAMPEIEINPEIIMLLFLPPLLYDAAFNISFQQFKTNINTIGTLAIGLVFLTTAGIAVIAYYLIPGMTWPLAFVLGSILSATDAVAAVGVTKGLGLSHRTMTILEGESLINDASALVAYRFAVAAVTGISFVTWKASMEFFVVLGGGFLIGWIVFKALALVIGFFRKDAMVVNSLILLMPFVTYLIAEHFEVSGVIAVVILGLGMSRLSRNKFPDHVKEQSRNFWDIIIFLLNGLIFLLIGLEFPIVLKKIPHIQVWTYAGYAVVIVLITLLIRMARVYLQQFNLQKAFQGKRKISEEALFDSKTSFIITWSGMRGIVSLAIALGLPATLNDGEPFPLRSEIVFLSIAVVLISLLGQGLTLPWIIKKLKL